MNLTTKVGILEFRYQHSQALHQQTLEHGFCSINLGDYIQSRAVQLLLESLGVPPEAIVKIDRDSLAFYSGEPVQLIMNGCFFPHCFPLPSQIEPIFVGFQTVRAEVISENLKFFKKYSPIGCRDNATRALFRQSGIDAYTSGCLSMTFPHRGVQPKAKTVFFIGGEGAGKMPLQLREHVPLQIMEGSTYVHQRERVSSHPLSDDDVGRLETLAVELIERYRTQASLVVTPLLHAASPCLAMGIPVILARASLGERFTAIDRILPVHTPENFASIDWTPRRVDLEALKYCLGSLVRRRLAGNLPEPNELQFLEQFYQKPPIPLNAGETALPISTAMPDSRSIALIEQYRILHESQSYGTGSERLFHSIQSVIEGFPSLGSILDYGCGRSRVADWLARVNGAQAFRFDPAIPQYDKRPTHKMDLVIVTNVLEHISEDMIDATLADIRALSVNAYFHIATASDNVVLPNGEPSRCTIRPPEWWQEKLKKFYKRVRSLTSKSKGWCAFVTFDWKSMRERKNEKLSQLKTALADIRGRDCVVFGSAPNPDFGNPAGEVEKIICCNGSALSLHRLFGRTPDYSFVHSHVFARLENEADADVRAAIEQCPELGHLTIFSSSKHAYSPNFLPKNVQSVNEFQWDLRFDVIRQLTGISLRGARHKSGLAGMDLSTGAVTVACAFFGGARSVRLVGFSFANKGHSYNAKALYRNHVSSDAALYALLSAYGFQITSTERSVASVLESKIE